jgi:adenylate cyclase
MADENLVRLGLQAIDHGVALADPETWAIQFENAKFFQWFAPGADVDNALATRLKGLDAEKAKSRLKDGKPFSFETEIKAGARTINLLVELRREKDESGAEVLLVQCHNISKQKEAEYMLDSYSKLAEKNAKDLQREKERVEKLLLNIMPKSVYEELRDYGTTTPTRFDAATVLMLDFVGFTDMAISRDPAALIAELNDIFTSFDRIVELFGCERIKTIGDAYVAVSGIPEQTPDHAANIARAALRIRRYLDRRNSSHPVHWKCRIGIATGPVIGSMVGIQKYVYDIFGPAPNLAARMEAQCEPMEICVNKEAHDLLAKDFTLTDRGETDIKGFGKMHTYSLDAETGTQR